MDNERAFFEKIASSMSDGWDIKIADHVQPGEVFQGKHDVRFYLIDTSKDWVTAAASSQSRFLEVASDHDVLSMGDQRIMSMAASALVTLSDGLYRPGFNGVEIAIRSAAAALTRTQTFVKVQERGQGLAGHWVFMAYRFANGSINTRPLYLDAQQNQQFLPIADLDQIVARIVMMDCDPNGTTEVSRVNRINGGAQLHPKWVNN